MNFPLELVTYKVPSVLAMKCLGDDERLTRYTLLAVCFMTCLASFPSGRFKFNKSQF